jgi:hypothetical protein
VRLAAHVLEFSDGQQQLSNFYYRSGRAGGTPLCIRKSGIF